MVSMSEFLSGFSYHGEPVIQSGAIDPTRQREGLQNLGTFGLGTFTGNAFGDGTDDFPIDSGEWLDTDGDGLGNNSDLDDDGDGLPDGWELQHGFDALAAGDEGLDPDADALDNASEFFRGTDPLRSDTDGDGVDDATDLFPLDSGEWVDRDGDGLGNNGDADDDGDGMPDTWESLYGLDPLDPGDADLDSDGDGFSNAEEFAASTDPLDRDEDGERESVRATSSTTPRTLDRLRKRSQRNETFGLRRSA